MSHAEGGYVTTGATREHPGYLFYAEAGANPEDPTEWIPLGSTTDDGGGETLAAIDDTLDGRCACGCGRKLGNSPSAWFCGQDCQMRWQQRQAVPPDDGWE